MPQLKQPASLEKIALDGLHKFVLDFCDKLSVDDEPDELRQGVCIIKKHICSCIPPPLLSEFFNRFFYEFCEFRSTDRSDSQKKAALEMIMDVKIVDLNCPGQIMRNLDPKDLRRLRIIKKLDVPPCYTEKIDFKNFLLTELTEFSYPRRCTDLDLKVIGQNCPKLEVLRVPCSDVSDEGLRALSFCSELRVVDVFNCPVSNDFINSLLSVNKKVKELSHWESGFQYQKTGEVSRLDSSVCPSMSRYITQDDGDVRTLDLQTVVIKFPNLTYLNVEFSKNEDLTILKSLTKLTGIAIDSLESFDGDVEELWESLKELLIYIGANLTTLKFMVRQHCFFVQEELNFIFTKCPHLEYFESDGLELVRVMPPFRKLQELILHQCEKFLHSDTAGFEFGIMPSLRTLALSYGGVTVKAIEATMLDNIKFPKLAVIKLYDLEAEEIRQLNRVARNKNLNFEVENDPVCHWNVESFRERRFQN